MNKIEHTDCFAGFEMPNGVIECTVLDITVCENCKFYRNDIKREDIEKDIEKYSSRKSIRNEHRL